jgi:hypothetical protein
MRAVAYGALLTVATLLAGSLALRALNKARQSTWAHKAAAVLPILFIVFTPLIMLAEKGAAWLEAERLAALILFEALAAAQFVLAVAMSRTAARAREI